MAEFAPAPVRFRFKLLVSAPSPSPELLPIVCSTVKFPGVNDPDAEYCTSTVSPASILLSVVQPIIVETTKSQSSGR